MNISDNGLDLIKRHECLMLTSYQDSVGVWTIGFGHTAGVKEGQTCTEEEANAYLREDAKSAERCVNSCVSVPLTQNEFDALCSFAFNLGCSALRNSTLLRLLCDSDYDGASKEFLKWTHAGGRELPGLVARRQAERDLFETA